MSRKVTPTHDAEGGARNAEGDMRATEGKIRNAEGRARAAEGGVRDAEGEAHAALHIARFAEIPDIPLTADQVIMLANRTLEPLYGPDAFTSQHLNAAVKDKLVPPPEKKHFDRGQVALLTWVFMLRHVLDTSSVDAFLKIVLWTYDLDEAYDRFCTCLEDALTAPTTTPQSTYQNVFDFAAGDAEGNAAAFGKAESEQAATSSDAIAAAAEAVAAQCRLTALIASRSRSKHER